MKNQILLFFFLSIILSLSSCIKEEIIEMEALETSTGTLPSYARGDNCTNIIGTPLGTVDILAGQNTDMGDINFGISQDGLYLVIEFDDIAQEGWAVGTTHIYAGSADNVPTSGGGNPKNGHFPYGTDNDVDISDIINEILSTGNYDSDFTYTIPLADILDVDPSSDPVCFVVLVHAEVYELSYDPNSNGSVNVTASETAWAAGLPFNSKGKKGNWSMYNEFCL